MTEEKPNKGVGERTGLALHKDHARSKDIESHRHPRRPEVDRSSAMPDPASRYAQSPEKQEPKERNKEATAPEAPYRASV
jgi:hypothetical protein